MKMNISDIKWGERIREDMGDLAGLQQSISQYGLFNPIVVNQKNELLAGARRLTACSNLGWTEIDVKVISTDGPLTKLEIESHENFMRKDFTEMEIEKIIEQKKKLARPGFFSSILLFFKKIFSYLGSLPGRLFNKKSNPQSMNP
ncbi:MAG: ParB N-terminal domain-containing protein [Spirochaetota bacterium]|nr:ParB N-terminal domain-containing protein [Spirochaetota bacterium]